MPTVEERFFSKVIKKPSGCWEWTTPSANKGYGTFTPFGRGSSIKAHRFAYELLVGEVGDMFVLHKCDNKACVNPEHLYLGRHGENAKDASERGQIRAGMKAKGLCHAQDLREQIAELYATTGMSQEALAKHLGISQASVSRYGGGLFDSHRRPLKAETV